MSKIYSVAVDGPSGAGKSTLSKAVAGELGILYVDTGAIYRTIGYYVFEKGIDPKDAPAVNAILPELDIQMRYADDGLQRMPHSFDNRMSRYRKISLLKRYLLKYVW